MDTEQATSKFAGIWYMRGLTPPPLIHALGSDCDTEFKCFNTNREFIEFLWCNTAHIAIIETQTLQEEGDIVRFIRSGLKTLPLVGLSDRDHILRHDFMKIGMDYVINPSNQEELRVVITRCLDRATPLEDQIKTKLSMSGWLLDTVRGELFMPDRKLCKLTSIERDFLRLLFSNEGRECSFEFLAAGLGIGPDEPYRHRLEVIVFRLRQKFKRQFAKDLPLYSLRGFGYVFSPNSDRRNIGFVRPRFAFRT